MSRLGLVALTGALSLALGTARAHEVDIYPGYQSAVYADPAHWLCRPDTDDVCDDGQDATIVRPSGKTAVQRWKPAKTPPIDCFYLYPTISTDQSGNSDLVPSDGAELFVVQQQAARLGAVCRVFAPVYRQVTLTALLGLLGGQSSLEVDRDLPDADVLDAWKHYIANDNGGRGVILIGHSQGAGRALTLLKNEVDANPDLRERLVSAMVIGSSVRVPPGADVGGDLQNIPLCRSPRQTGCVISYATFRDTAPAPANSFFGTPADGLVSACTNPASLQGGRGALQPYFPTNGTSLPILTLPPPEWVEASRGVTIATPFVMLPRMIDATCAEQGGIHYLALTVKGNPKDPRIDDIGGDLTPEWGMHLVDVNVAMGNLVSVARQQAKAHVKRHR